MRLPNVKARVYRYTDANYWALCKEYKKHPGIDAMYWPLWYIRNGMAMDK